MQAKISLPSQTISTNLSEASASSSRTVNTYRFRVRVRVRVRVRSWVRVRVMSNLHVEAHRGIRGEESHFYREEMLLDGGFSHLSLDLIEGGVVMARFRFV